MSFLQHQSLNQYCISKFQADQILLTNKTNKITYQYYNLKFTSMFYNKNRIHEMLQQPIIVFGGVLYEKELTCLMKQIQNKKQRLPQINFSQQQLVNTFIPIIQCLESLHQKDISHGGICPEAIVFDKNGNIKIRNMIDVCNNIYYHEGISSLSNDMRALGYVLLECTTLKDNLKNNVNSSLSSVIKMYSKGLIYAIIVMTNRMSQYLPKLIKMMQNLMKQEQICNQLREHYQKIEYIQNKYTLINKQTNNRSLKNQHTKYLTFTKISNKFNGSQNKQTTQDRKNRLQKIKTRISQKNSELLSNLHYSTKEGRQLNPETLKKVGNWNVKINQILKNTKQTMLGIKNREEFMSFKSPMKRLRSTGKMTNKY